MNHLLGRTLTVLVSAFIGLPAMLPAQVSTGYPLIFRPQNVDLHSDMPEELATADSISRSAANPPAADTGASSDHDSELNGVYKKLLNDHKNDYWFTTSLRETQRAWLQFRDARAALESVIAGKSTPDGPTITRLTQARLEDLKHIAIDGLPSDFGSISTENGLRSQIEERYNQFRQAIVDRKSADLLVAWIATQQAWNGYFEHETEFDSHTPLPDWDLVLTPKGDESDSSATNKLVSKKGLADRQLYMKSFNRLDQANWADLRTLARELGLNPDQPPDSSKTVFDAQLDSETVLSPRKDLRVEFWYPDNSQSQKAVVISNADNSQQELVDPSVMVSLVDKTYSASSDVHISPDSHWIFQVAVRSKNRDFYGGAQLYEVIRTKPVELRGYFTGKSFAEVAFRNFNEVHGKDSADSINFVDWESDRLIFNITSDADNDNSEHKWRCEFNLKEETFAKPVKSNEPSSNE